jgi:RNA recognition motif-containing protein
LNIFVGNLLFEATEADVKDLFSSYGSVLSVAIVMEKNGRKSRGFGFVEMPDEEQAQAAIVALNGKDFMGRVLNVSPSVPKTSAEKDAQRKKNKSFKDADLSLDRPKRPVAAEQSAFKQFFPNPVSFKGGRRTRSYFRKQAASGVIDPIVFRKKQKDNPMRWLKKRDQRKSWNRPDGESKPWKKDAGEARPQNSFKSEPKPWHKDKGKAKPWDKKTRGFKSWDKPEGESRPWKKDEGRSKTWRKSSESSKQSRFKTRPKRAFKK